MVVEYGTNLIHSFSCLIFTVESVAVHIYKLPYFSELVLCHLGYFPQDRVDYDAYARKREESDNLWSVSLMAKQECSLFITPVPLFFSTPDALWSHSN